MGHEKSMPNLTGLLDWANALVVTPYWRTRAFKWGKIQAVLDYQRACLGVNDMLD